jgi:hypothetical protein
MYGSHVLSFELRNLEAGKFEGLVARPVVLLQVLLFRKVEFTEVTDVLT